MEIQHNPSLTAPEMVSLWSLYIENTKVICFLKYLSAVNEDNSAKPLYEEALKTYHAITNEINQIFIKEKMPIPVGFSEEDVNVTAPRLYSDVFGVRYMKFSSGIALTAYSGAHAKSARSDIRDFFSRAQNDVRNIFTC
jgi:hypothetical protein